jgi:hypothetical protein
MTDETRSDLPTAEGAPAPQKKTAAAQQDASPLTEPLPSPSSPAGPGGTPETWDAAGESLELTEADFEGAVGHDEKRVLKRSNAKLPSAWILGPGQVELLVEGCKLLKGAATAAGTPMAEVKAVIVKALPKSGLVLVAPAKEGAAQSIETRQEGHGSIHFTISAILLEAGMQIATGYRELFPVKKVVKSPIGPAIAISVAKALQSKRIERKKKAK